MIEIAPTKPKVKPMPKRQEPKPRPRREDPWTVPGPKVNPTPKAIKNNTMTKKKMLVTSKNDFNALKKIVSRDTFYKKFVLAMNVVSEITAEEAVTNLYFEDSRMLTTDELADLRQKGLI